MSDWMDLDEDPGLHIYHTPKQRATANPRPVTNLDDDNGEYVELCSKCNGSGRWVGGYVNTTVRPCFACKGQGKLIRRTPPEQRAKARQRYASQKALSYQETQARKAEWMKANPEQKAWMERAAAKGFEFALAMQDAVARYGGLTEKQQATVDRLTQQDKDYKAQKEKREATAPPIRMDKIEEAFAKARSEGKNSQLKLCLDTFVFSPASARGVNAGAIYVKENDLYLGKIANGKFIGSRDCSELTSARILKVASDPKAAAIAYGKRTGNCACCGRLLTNEGSVDLGIGPVCAGKWGW